MKKDIFSSQANPFTVPDGYFDTLQERIMSRIEAEKNAIDKRQPRIYPLIAHHSSYIPYHYRKWIAAAACLLFIFTGATLYMRYSEPQFVLAELVLDDDFYQWLYASDEATLLAESLNIAMSDDFMYHETEYSEEDAAIIAFLERDNISVAAILHSFDNELFLIP